VSFILVVSIITVFVNRGSTQSGTNDAIGSGIVNQAESAAEEAATVDFPVTQQNPEAE
jgi:hypothetical protein